MSPTSLSDLCLRCGLCCNGSLFRFVRLTAEEVERLRGLGGEVFSRRDGTPALRLGCRLLDGSRCTAYDSRPGGCRAFVCSLGRALEAGDIGFAAALERVLQARALVDAVAQNLPPPGSDGTRSALQRANSEGLLCGPEPLRRAEAFLRDYFL